MNQESGTAIIKFGLKAVALILICFGPYLFLRHQNMLEKDIDYSKFTHKADHLILGVSRAKVGIVPAVLKDRLNLDGEVLNFAFTGLVSPYHQDYYELAKRKVRKDQVQGSLFILSVNPGNLGSGQDFLSRSAPIYDLYLVNSFPNPEYILKNINMQNPFMFDLLQPSPKEKPMFVAHPDGWGERTRDSEIPDSSIYNTYQRSLASREYDKDRIEILSKLIQFLKEYGNVVLVRMPVDRKMAEMEGMAFPDFDNKLSALAQRYNAHYLNYPKHAIPDLEFSDPHHLLNTGAKRFTEQLANDIQALNLPGLTN